MDERHTRLERFIGEWTMHLTFPGAPPVSGGRVVFEWMTGERFLIQRWEVPVPEAPDGLAIIGFDEGRGTFLQHYFDSRGIARVYADELGGRGLDAAARGAGLLATGVRAALHGDVQRRRQDYRRPLGDRPRRIDLGARLRPDLRAGWLTRAGHFPLIACHELQRPPAAVRHVRGGSIRLGGNVGH